MLVSAYPCLADISVKAEIDKKNLTTDEVLTYKVIVVYSKENPPKLKLPKLDDFRVISQVQSSSVQFSAEGKKNTTIFAFVLLPLKAGELQIKPAEVNSGKNSFTTDAFKIQVKQGKIKPPPKQTFPDAEQTTL